MVPIDKYFSQFSRIKVPLIILVFFALGFLIYSNTFQSPFVFDDKLRILDNPAIRLEELSAQRLWDAAFGKYSARSRPVGNISFALNYYFHGYEPAGYHLVNITVHIISGILLWLFLSKTLGLIYGRPGQNGAEWIALAAALLWLANPVQTQSVTYIVQRLNGMAAMFFLLSFVSYLNGRLATRKRRRRAWFIGSALAWLLALGCKQNTATLPFFIFLYEWYFFQDLSLDWLKRNLKFIFIIMAIFVILAFLFLGTKPAARLTTMSDFANQEFTISERLLTQLRVVIYYLGLIIFPHPSRLNLDHDFGLSHSLFNPATTLLSLFGIIGLIALGIFLARKQRLTSFCIFWFLGNLIIESSVIPLAIIFEHRLYLPSMLVWLVPIMLFYRYLKIRWLPTVVSCALIVFFSYWTFERNKVWQDNTTLWADCVKKSPNKARPYSNLGAAQKLQNKTEEAVQNFLKALQLDPDFEHAHNNLGIILDEQGKIDEAIVHFRRAVEIKPNFAKALNNLGTVLLKQDKTNEAIEHFRKALQVSPNFALAHSNLGLAHVKQGKIDEAVENFLSALQMNPDLAEAQFSLGDAYSKQGRPEQAIFRFQQALKLDPNHALAHNNLGGHLLSQGKIDDALTHFNRALEINPDLAETHNNVGIILIQRGDTEAAISHFQDALRINPDFEQARNNLRRALAIRNSMGSELDNVQRQLAAQPDNAALHFKLGNMYLGKRDLDRAIAAYENALALQPEFVGARNNLALACIAGRRYDQALTTLKKLTELDPENAGNYYNIAVVYALKNDVPQSISWLKKAISRGYENWELIKTDKDLDNIRGSEEYQELVKGH
jgi:tetratricopeptide (TPR) repeat protein